jgi:hypothetical protein
MMWRGRNAVSEIFAISLFKIFLGAALLRPGSRIHLGTAMSEDFDRLVKLFNLERLFQHGHRTDLQDPVKNFAIRVPGNNDYVKIWVNLFRRPIYLIAWSIRELQIEEHEIELLFSKADDCIFSGSNYDPAEPNLF